MGGGGHNRDFLGGGACRHCFHQNQIPHQNLFVANKGARVANKLKTTSLTI